MGRTVIRLDYILRETFGRVLRPEFTVEVDGRHRSVGTCSCPPTAQEATSALHAALQHARRADPDGQIEVQVDFGELWSMTFRDACIAQRVFLRHVPPMRTRALGEALRQELAGKP